MLNPSVKFLLIGDQPKCLGPLRKQQFGVACAKRLAGGLAEVTSRHVGLVLMTLIAACTLRAADHPDFPQQIQQTRTNAVLHGAIGVGAWSTTVEYKDVVVTSNGVELYRSDFENNAMEGWRVQNGDWSVKDGALRQTAFKRDCTATTGNTNWANYTLALRARKIEGIEGFLVLFNRVDDKNWTWLNIRAWANSTNSICLLEQNIEGTRVTIPGSAVTNRAFTTNVWYDIRIVLNGPRIECYVDSQLLMAASAFTMVTTNAEYLGRATLVDSHVLQFRSDGHVFQCTLPRSKGEPPLLEPGSLVRVSGMMSVGSVGAANVQPGSSAPEFDMMLLSPNDVVLLKVPSWWNWRRLAWAITIILVIVITAAAWIAMISRRNRLLKIAKLELQRANEELEVRVERRTADLAKANAELGREQELLRTLLDNASDHIYFKDANSYFVRCSQSLCARSGFTHEQMVGKSDFDLFLEEHARSAFEDEQEIIRTGKPLIGKLEEERHPDGRATWLMTTKMPWRDAEQKIIGTFGISRDITAIKEAEARLKEVHKQLVDISRQAGQAEVASNVLHNVGNVLNSVNVSTNLLIQSVRKSRVSNLPRVVAMLQEHAHDLGAFITSDSKGKLMPAYLAKLSENLLAEQETTAGELNSLQRNIEHINEIVARQQNYARVGGVKEIINVVNLVEESLRMNEGALSRHGVEVVREFENVPPINVDKHKILQILVNLVSNAEHACQESERTDKRLTVRVVNGDGRIKISVIDNGVGISPENLTRIFNHGFTTRKDGHGFGLHSGALAAKEIGGLLNVHSGGSGQGAAFTLELPCPTPGGPT